MAISPDDLKKKLAAKRQQNLSGGAEQREVASPYVPETKRALVSQDASPSQTPQRRSPAPRHKPAEQDNLPSAPEIEKAVLSTIFKSSDGFATFERIGRKGFFADPVNRELYDLGKAFYQDNGRIDLIGFTAHLGDAGRLPSLRGPGYVTELFIATAPAEMLEYYVDQLRETYIRRQIIMRSFALGNKAKNKAKNESLNDLLDELEETILDLKRVAGGPNGSEIFDFDRLMAFDSAHDPKCLIGNRYIVRAGSSLWAGGSGYGKSSLLLQLAVYWGCGVPCFGLRPIRPLKSLIIQAENDFGDMSEQLQGVFAGVNAIGDIDVQEKHDLIEKNVGIHRSIGKSGTEFLVLLDRLVELDRPDMVWIDPLFAFSGCDLLNPEKTGRFLREGLFSIADKRNVAVNVIHHVGKPVRESKGGATVDMSEIDYQYLGFGTSEIQNAFRAINVLIPLANTGGVYKLVLSKRGQRACAKNTQGEWTRSIFLKHATEGICWMQCEEPEPETDEGGRPQKFTLKDLLSQMSVVHPIKTNKLIKICRDELNMSRATFFRLFMAGKEEKKIVPSDGGWIVSKQ